MSMKTILNPKILNNRTQGHCLIIFHMGVPFWGSPQYHAIRKKEMRKIMNNAKVLKSD